MTIFGSIITGSDVEAAVRTTVQRWQGDYLAEIAEQHGRARGDLPRFRSFLTTLDLDKFSEDQTPACLVVAPGTVELPEKWSEKYLARWAVGVGCVVSGQDEANTYELISLYAAAVRAMIVQHKSLGGFAENTVWASERYDELATSDLRTIAAGTVQFYVDVKDVVDTTLGPTTPSVDSTVPPGNWPTAQTVTVATTRRS
jgi:hypothetical protein